MPGDFKYTNIFPEYTKVFGFFCFAHPTLYRLTTSLYIYMLTVITRRAMDFDRSFMMDPHHFHYYVERFTFVLWRGTCCSAMELR